MKILCIGVKAQANPMKASPVSNKRTAFCAATLITGVLLLLAMAHGGVHHRLSSVVGRYFSYGQPPSDSDAILESVLVSDGTTRVYRFANGRVEINEGQQNYTQMASDQQSTAQTVLASLRHFYKRLLLDLSARCCVARQFEPQATSPSTDDGGQDLCMVGRYEPRHPCYVFSFRVAGTWELEDALAASRGCQVLAFDPTMRGPSRMRSELVLLFREGLSALATRSGESKSPPADNFLGYLRRFKADGMTVDILRIGAGANGWPALEAAVRDGSLRRVKQLILSSDVAPESAKQLRSRVHVLRSLQELGFRQHRPSGISNNSSSDEARLSFINVNFLTNQAIPARNTHTNRLHLPYERMAISRGPSFSQLEGAQRLSLQAMSAAQLDVLYFQLVEQQHLYCPHSRRIGNVDDGGWDVCFSGPFNIANSRPCVAFSFGINNVWLYDDQLADKYHCRVFMFDPSMAKVQDHQRRTSSWFYRTGLSDKNTVESNGWKMRTLCQIFNDSGYRNRTIDILKVDIEYWEWAAFEKALADGCLKQVKQFMFETHTTGLYRKQSDYARFSRVLLRIFDLGFRTWKWHKNPQSRFYKSASGLTRACCYEHYLINTHFMQSPV